tara:strand:- start:966 stop:1556 length:591 start_codon:yes stop_codon:yes gene_type:complete
MEKEGTVLGLDVSTKTIGIALFNMDGKLLELTHITPRPKPKPGTKVGELIKKANIFGEFIEKYKKLKINTIIIEEPLLRSNNVNTVGTLLRYNGMISKICYDELGVLPEYISTYNSRKFAFPELMKSRKEGLKPVLFGGHDTKADKKMIVWEKVANLEPQIVWLYTRNQTLKKESFDMTDAYACVLGHMKEKGIWS